MSLTLHTEQISTWEPLRSKEGSPLLRLLSRWRWSPGINKQCLCLGKVANGQGALSVAPSPLAVVQCSPPTLPSPPRFLLLFHSCEWEVWIVEVGVFPAEGFLCVNCWAVCSEHRFCALSPPYRSGVWRRGSTGRCGGAETGLLDSGPLQSSTSQTAL